MQHDLFLSGHDLNLRSNFPNDLLKEIVHLRKIRIFYSVLNRILA